MTAPAIKVYVGLGSTWKTADSSITWTNITGQVKKNPDWGVDRGRSSELDDFRAGTCSLVLLNDDRRFDPSHASGPYFGQLLPGVPLKITATPAGGTETQVFRGFVQGWPQDGERNLQQVVRIRASDGLAKLATAGTPTSVYALAIAEDSPDAWYRLSETAGTIMGDSSGNGRHGTYDSGQTFYSTDNHPNRWESGTSCIDIPEIFPVLTASTPVDGDASMTFTFLARVVQRVNGSNIDGGRLFLYNDSWKVTYGQWPPAPDPAASYLTAKDNGATGVYAVILSSQAAESHHIAIRYWAGGSFDLYLDGVLQSKAAHASLTVGTGTTMSIDMAGIAVADIAVWNSDIGTARLDVHGDAFHAPWDGDTTGARVIRILDVVDWPADLRDIETGDSTLGPAVLGKPAYSIIKKIEAAEQGRVFVTRDGKLRFLNRTWFATETTGSTSQATFDDGAAGIGYSGLAFDYDDRLIYNRIRGSRETGATREEIDQASIDAYGEQIDDFLTGVALPDDSTLVNHLLYRLSRYKDPKLRARPIEVPLHRLNPTHQGVVLGLEIGHRVTVQRTPNGVGAAIVQQTFIERIEHRGSGVEHWVTLALSPTDTTASAIWGTSEWDDADALWGV